MRSAPAMLLALAVAGAAPAADAPAGTAYVTDELVLGVYSAPDAQSPRLATLHSGAAVETLGGSGEFTHVRLADGTAGWVKSSYLTAREPAGARIKQLQEELDRSRATTPALAEAAARSEVEQLRRDLEAARAEAAALRGQPGAARTAAGAGTHGPQTRWPAVAAVGFALAAGFWAGYATLARRVRAKFGGIKVY